MACPGRVPQTPHLRYLGRVAHESSPRAGSPVPLVVHGAGGTGKDFVLDQLALARIISVTDRHPRDAERDGRDYYFVHPEMFQTLIDCGAFAEWAPVLRYSKGTTRRVIEAALASGNDFVIKTDIQGAATWRTRLPGCVTVRLLGLPSERSLEEHKDDLRMRLAHRDAPAHEVDVRLMELEAEYATGCDDYTVVNPWGAAESAVANLRSIVATERLNPLRPAPRLLLPGA